VLLSQVHRLRALVLLGRFLDMGPWAVDLALSVGIFPYVLKLLQTTSIELRTTLVFIWAKILALDRSCQADLVKDNGHLYFLKYLDAPEPGLTEGQRAQAAFVLAMVCDHHPRGQSLCAAAQLPQTLLCGLRAQLPELHGSGGAAFLSKWLCLCLGKVADGMPEVCAAAAREGAQDLLAGLLGAPLPELRAAAVYALGCLINPAPRRPDLAAAAVAAAAAGAPPPSAAIAAEAVAIAAEQSIVLLMLRASVGYDASPLVRAEVAVALARLVKGHASLLTDAVAWMQDHIAAQQRRAAELMRSSRGSTSRNAQAGASSSGGAAGGSSSSGGARSVPAASGSTAGAASAAAAAAAAAAGGDPSGSSPAAAAGGGAGVTSASSSDNLSRWGDAAAGLDPTDAYSADAFGVNSSMGLYCAVIELVLMLATDPAPKVAAYGKKVLQLAGLDLAPPAAAGSLRVPVTGSSSGAYHSQGGSMGSSSGSHPVPGGGAGGSPLGGGPGVTLGSAGASGGGGHLSASLGSLTSKLVKGAGRNWRSGFSGSMSGTTAAAPATTSSRAAPGSVSSTPNSSSPPSPHREWPPVVYGRNPYILRSTNSIAGAGSSGSNLQQQPSGSFAVDPHAAAVAGGLSGAGGGMQSASSSSLSTFAGEELQPGVVGGVGSGASLPQSQIFQLSCEYFSRPMLEPMVRGARVCGCGCGCVGGAATSNGVVAVGGVHEARCVP
jgi:regulator-associated protein of mTOR